MLTSLRHSLGRLSPTKPSSPSLHFLEDDEDVPCDSQDTTMDESAMASSSAWEPSVWGRLEVINRNGKVQGTLPIVERECNIGRSSDNDLRCCEIGISRHACKIAFDAPQRAQILLVGSNKITINGRAISPTGGSDHSPASHPLTTGDVIELQKYTFRFHYEQATRPSTVSVPPSPHHEAGASSNGGKRRRVRMSLVHVANVETPNKQQQQQQQQQAQSDVPPSPSSPSSKVKRRVSLLVPGEAEITNNQAQVVPASPTSVLPEIDMNALKRRGRQSIAAMPSTPSSSSSKGFDAVPQSVPRDHRIVTADVSLVYSENGLEILSDRKQPASPRSHSPPSSQGQDGDEVLDQVVVLDDGDGDDDEQQQRDSDRDQDLATATQGLGISEQGSPSNARRRRSSILGRMWPFGGSPNGAAGTSLPEAELANTDARKEDDGANTSPDDEEDLLDEAEVEDAQDLLPPLPGSPGGGPRLPRSMSSPGRLSASPSFTLDGRRKVSLRTRTLLKSSAVLAEKLEAEAELSPPEPASTATQESGHGGKLRLGEPFALHSQLPPTPPADVEYEPASQLSMVAEDADDDEGEGQGERDDADEDEVDRSLASASSEDQVPELVPQRPSAYKRLSLPAAAATTSTPSSSASSSTTHTRRFSLFGGLPKLRSSSEAEDVVDATRAERMGHARRQSSFEPSSMQGNLLRAPRDPSLSEAAYATLRVPARDALRYLLSKKPAAATAPSPKVEDATLPTAPAGPYASPVLQSSGLPASFSTAGTPGAPPTPKYGQLRELMLGRPENVELLEQTRGMTSSSSSSKRRSLMLSPATSSLDAPTPPMVASPVMRSSAATTGIESTPDVVFLKQTMQMAEEDIDGDVQVKALRQVFRVHKAMLARDDFALEHPMQVEALATLLASPAAHRALLGAAASVGRLSKEETALQASALAHKHKKTRRGCRGGRRRSKSYGSGALEGEGEGERDGGEENGKPAEEVDEDGPDAAAVKQVQEIQKLLDRLGPLAPGVAVVADRALRRQSLGSGAVASFVPPSVAEEKPKAPRGAAVTAAAPSKSFAADDTSFDDVETDAEDEGKTVTKAKRKSVVGAAAAAAAAAAASPASPPASSRKSTATPAHRRGASIASASADRDGEDAVSNAGSADSSESSQQGQLTRQRSQRRSMKPVANAKDENGASSISSKTAAAARPRSNGRARQNDDDDDSVTTRREGEAGAPDSARAAGRGRHTRATSSASVHAPSSAPAPRTTRHTRTRSAAPSDDANGQDVQSSPVKRSSGASRGKAPPTSRAAGATASKAQNGGSNSQAPRKRNHLGPATTSSSVASSDLPHAPESEPVRGAAGADGGPTTRLRSGRVVRAGGGGK